jgi:hypothetical protein
VYIYTSRSPIHNNSKHQSSFTSKKQTNKHTSKPTTQKKLTHFHKISPGTQLHLHFPPIVISSVQLDAAGNDTELIDVLRPQPQHIVAHLPFGPFHDFQKIEDSHLFIRNVRMISMSRMTTIRRRWQTQAPNEYTISAPSPFHHAIWASPKKHCSPSPLPSPC